MLEEQEEAVNGLKESEGVLFKGEERARCRDGHWHSSLLLHLSSGAKGKKDIVLYMLPWSHGFCSIMSSRRISRRRQYISHWKYTGQFLPSSLHIYEQGISAVLKKLTEIQSISCWFNSIGGWLPFPPGEREALTLLAERTKEKCNSTHPGSQKVCLNLLQAQNYMIWGYSAAYPWRHSTSKSSEVKQEAKSIRSHCWKLSQKYWMSSWVTEDFGREAALEKTSSINLPCWEMKNWPQKNLLWKHGFCKAFFSNV